MADRSAWLIAALLLAGLLPSNVRAASFDCGKAKTRFEKTVCADPQLSAQDAVLAGRYDAALAALSGPGKTLLRGGQEQWLNVAKILCVDNKRDESPVSCLRQQYADRLDDLGSAAVAIGPFVFSRSDHYASLGKTSTGVPAEQHIGLPRIDHPLSSMAQQWNAAIIQAARAAQAHWCYGDPGTAGDQFVSFKIRSATLTFINVEMLHTEQCDLAAGAEDMHNISYLLTPSLHRLEAADLFKPDSHWQRFLSERAVRQLSADGADIFADGIDRAVGDPAAWSFTKPGLLISFNPGEAEAIASGLLEVTIPWADLQPLLAPGAPIPR